MAGVNMFVISLILLLEYFPFAVTTAGDKCGHLRVIEPAVEDRKVSLKFVPAENSSAGKVQWERRGGSRPWSELKHGSEFNMYSDNVGHYYLIIKDAKLKLDEVEYHTKYTANGKTCISNSVSLELTVLKDCGLLYLRSEPVIIGQDVELGYYPSTTVHSNHDIYVRYWYHGEKCVSGCKMGVTGNKYETQFIDMEHILKIKNFQTSDEENYTVQCTSNRGVNKRTNAVQVISPVSPTSVVLNPLTTADFCTNCITGNDGSEIDVTCKVNGGSKPYNVTLLLDDVTITESLLTSDDQIMATITLNDSYQGHEFNCSARNYATIKPMTTAAKIYVIKVHQVAPLLLMPDQLIEGETIDIKCMVEDRRPPAEDFSLWIDNMKIENVKRIDQYNITSKSYNSYITLTEFHRHWNQKQVQCCEYNFRFEGDSHTICSETETAKFHYPPDNVSLYIDNTSIENNTYYLLRARCFLTYSYPKCDVTWETNGEIVSHIVDNTNAEENKTFGVFIRMTMEVKTGVVTCIPKCEDRFKKMPSESLSFRLPQRPGQLEFNTSREVYVKRGDTIGITCSSVNNPPATISWYNENNTQVNCTEDTTAPYDPPAFSVLHPPPDITDKTNTCTMKFHANTSLDILQFYCQACNNFGCYNETLTINIRDTTSDDQESIPGNEESSKSFWPLPIEILASIAGGVVLIIVVTIVIACKCRSTKAKENDIPLNDVNNEIGDQQEPPPRNEGPDNQRQLEYADLVFGNNPEASKHILANRESEVEYTEVEFGKSAAPTVEVSDEENSTSIEQEDKHIYVNEEQSHVYVGGHLCVND